jgi:hypothetical protein
LADWNDFPALSKSIATTCGIKKIPALRKNESENAIQQLYPIDPPHKLILEFGKASGIFDAVRFAFEFGKGVFYAGMNPALDAEHRVCGDPSLPLFWGYLFAGMFSKQTGLQQFVNLQSVQASPELLLFTQFWIRYDAVLACYKNQIDPELKGSRDLYVSLFRNAFSLIAPDLLHLYDLERSEDSLFRVVAYRAALAAEERFRTLYGNSWFTSPKCSARIREYWRHGFQTNLRQVLDDIDASPDPDFLLTVKG